MSELENCYVIDRRYLELVDDPLLYIIRQATMKNIQVTDVSVTNEHICANDIRIRVAKGDNLLNVQVHCEHGGMDYEAILKTWAESIYPSSIPQETRDGIYVACLPGFKTAQKYDVNFFRKSGSSEALSWPRFNTLIQKNNEEPISKSSSTLNIQLPLTNSIIQCLIVKSQRKTIAVPVQLVSESMLINAQDVHWGNEFESITFHGDTIPVMYGSQKEFQQPMQQLDPKKMSLIILDLAGKKIACFVDEIIGLQPLILKSLERFFQNDRGYLSYKFESAK